MTLIRSKRRVTATSVAKEVLPSSVASATTRCLDTLLIYFIRFLVFSQDPLPRYNSFSSSIDPGNRAILRTFTLFLGHSSSMVDCSGLDHLNYMQVHEGCKASIIKPCTAAEENALIDPAAHRWTLVKNDNK